LQNRILPLLDLPLPGSMLYNLLSIQRKSATNVNRKKYDYKREEFNPGCSPFRYKDLVGDDIVSKKLVYTVSMGV
jgi:hypothetical protein